MDEEDFPRRSTRSSDSSTKAKDKKGEKVDKDNKGGKVDTDDNKKGGKVAKDNKKGRKGDKHKTKRGKAEKETTVQDVEKQPADNRVLFQEEASRRTSKRKITKSSGDEESQKTKKPKKKKKKTPKQSQQDDDDDGDEDAGSDGEDEDASGFFLDDSDDDEDEEEESVKPQRKKKEKSKKEAKRTKKTKFEKDLEEAAAADDDSDVDDDVYDISDDEDDEGKKAGNRKGKVKPLKGSMDEDVEAFDGGVRRRLYIPISQKTITSDLLLLGVVKEVRDYEIVVSLPGGATGFLRITDISDIYTRCLERMSTSDEEGGGQDELDVPRPSEVFQVGCLLMCKVKSSEATTRGRPRLQVTVKPNEVNGQLNPVMMKKGMVVNGSVSSKEDHGYIIDVGVGKVQAFLGWKDARQYETERNLGKPLYMGQPVQCVITKVQSNGRSLILTCDPSVVAEAVGDKESHSALQTLLPGTSVPVTVAKVNKDHLVVTVLGSYSGHICQTHLEEHNYTPSHYKPKQELFATVICNNYNLKTVALSLNQHHGGNHFEVKVEDPFASVQQGDTSEDAKTLRVDAKLGVLVKFNPTRLKGYVHPSQYSDKASFDISKVKQGQRIKCRVVDFNWFDGLAVLSAKKSVVELPFLGYHGIQPGDILEGKVFSFSDKGVKVQVADRTFGFIPNSHLADIPISKPKDKYKEGDKLKLRVLSVDALHRRLLLTHKKTMVTSSHPAISAYDQVVQDMMLHGVIVAVKPFGCIVSFYNDVKGLIPTNELSSDPTLIPAQVFRFGQVVKCRVIQAHHPTLQKITLSLRSAGSRDVVESSTKKKKSEPIELESNVQIGQIESVRVTSVSPDGLMISVISDGTDGFIPIMHLSDHHDNCRALLACYKEGAVISNAMSWSYSPQKSCTIFTLKRCIRETSDTLPPSQLKRLEDGTTLMGHVKTIMSYGVFVEGHNNLIGLAPKGGLSDEFVQDTQQCYNNGQTVRAQVTQVDKEKGRFLVSLRPSVVKTKKDEGLHLLEDYLSERDILAKKLPAEYKHILKMSPGTIVNATVTGKQDGRLVCSLPHDIMGIVLTQGSEEEHLEEGSQVEACVLHNDIINSTVYLSVKSQLLENDPKSKKKRSKLAEATVEFVHPHYVLAYVSGEGLVYLPGKKHLNDLETRKERPVEGQTLNVSLKRVLNGRVLVEVVHKTGEDSEKFNKKLSKAEKLESMKEQHLGQIVKAKIESIHELQLYVTTCKGIFGRVHATQITDDISPKKSVLNSFKIGDNVKAKVIGHRELKDQHILAITGRRFKRMGFELSLRKSVLESDSKIEDEAPIEQQLSCYQPGQAVKIVAQAFKKKVLWVTLTPTVHGKVFQSNLPSNREVTKNPQKAIKPGTVHQAHVVRVDMKHQLIELTMTGDPSIIVSDGNVVKGQISSINPGHGLTIQLPNHLQGNVHITDIHDRLQDDPLKGFKKNQRVSCYVLSQDKDTVSLSMKPSLVVRHRGEKDPKTHPYSDVQEGQLVTGYVMNKSDKGVFVCLSRTQTGRISVHKIPKSQRENLEALYPAGKLVVARVLSVSAESGQINLSRLPKDILPIPSAAEIIVPEAKELNSDIGVKTVRKRKSSQSEESGMETTPTKKQKSLEVSDDEKDEGTDDDQDKGTALTKPMVDKKKKQKKKRVPVRRSERRHNDLGLTFESDELSDTEVEVEITMEPSSTAEPSNEVSRLTVDAGFSWDDNVATVTSITKPSIIRKEEEDGSSSSSSEDESDEEKEDEVQKKPVKKSRKEIEAERKADEDYLYKTEHALMDNERTPQTAEDFDRVVLSSPDSSLVWIRYMAFHLHTAEVERARAVAEGALKAISFREEQEKLNVWVAFLNLENMYGTEETLMKVFERALQFNEPIKVFQQLVNIYIRTEKIQAAEELYSTMVKRFNFNKETWVSYGMFLMKNKKQDAARKLMQRSFKSIPQTQHVDIIIKFSQLEFKFGEVERGKTMFENVLSNYPKRTDIWSVYLDMMIKNEDLEATRHVFERVIHLTLSAKKMKFFFKRYLDFEKKYGTELSVDNVKQKAVEYVESKASVVTTDES